MSFVVRSSSLTRLLVAGVAVVALSGCSEARRTLGLDRTVPDEFAVVSRAPLTLPPDFTLKPPRPGAVRPQEGTTRQQAAAAVFGAPAANSTITDSRATMTASDANAPVAAPRDSVTRQSSAEANLLSRAGADQAQPDIRATVDRETAAIIVADQSFADALIFWRDPEQPATVVDARRESQRLKDNKAGEKSLTDGDTPMIKRGRRAPLEGLFN